MAALDFPASPVDGQVYSNWVYSTSKGAWQAKPLTPGQAQPSATAPTSPSNGDQWYNTNDGNLYIYYNDGDTSQWVQVKSNSAYASTLGQTVDALNANGNQNYIINGAFDFWQRGTTGTTGGYVTADRWYQNANNSTTFARDTNVPDGFQYSFKLTAGANGLTMWADQVVETMNAIVLANKTVTVSSYLYASSSTPVTLSLYYSTVVDNPASYARTNWTLIGSQSYTATTSWGRTSYTGTVPANAKTLMVSISSTSATVSGGSIQFTGVQLQAGVVATAFHRSAGTIQGELAACQRYYQRLTPGTQYGVFGAGVCVGNPYIAIAVQLPVQMRTTPSSIEYSSLVQFEIQHGNTKLTPPASLYADSLGVNSSRIIVTHASAVANTSCLLQSVTGNTTAYIGFNAEL